MILFAPGPLKMWRLIGNFFFLWGKTLCLSLSYHLFSGGFWLLKTLNFWRKSYFKKSIRSSDDLKLTFGFFANENLISGCLKKNIWNNFWLKGIPNSRNKKVLSLFFLLILCQKYLRVFFSEINKIQLQIYTHDLSSSVLIISFESIRICTSNFYTFFY